MGHVEILWNLRQRADGDLRKLYRLDAAQARKGRGRPEHARAAAGDDDVLRPMIYATNESWELYIQEQFDDYPLWIRDIWNTPKNSADWVIWQYTNRGRLKGFSGDEPYVDLNVFAGTVEEWENSYSSG